MGFFKTKSHALKDVAAKIFLPVALSAALLVGTIGGMNSVFAAENEYDMANNDGKYYSDYSSLEETWDASLEVNRQIAEESVVLLKNQNDTLPLSGVKYISVFGKDSADFYYAGGGSGTAEGYYDDDQYYTLDQSLADAGYSVNPVLRRFYENDSLSGSYSAGGNYVNETDPSKFTAGVLDSYDRYSDAALIVLGRTGSEGGDLYMGGYDEEGNELKHALELTDAEANLVKHVTANFDTVIVVLNVPMQMELGWIDAEEGDPEYLGDIDAAFWIGHTGLNGAIAVGETLNGTINPSGKLADIYARDFKKDPTYFNAQDNLHIQDGTTDYQYKDGETTWLVHSVEYEEGIYYGYRYYETRAAAYAGAVSAIDEEEYADGEAWYQSAVVYPFGYGMSYTEFDWEMGEVKDDKDANGDRYFEIPVTVTNTGSVAGKDVVEMYYTAPYIAGEIEKSHVVLGDFAKTDLLKPGQSQTLTLKIYLQDMASYDYADDNKNDHTGYELDAGEYTLKLMTDSHNIKASADGEELTYSFTLNEDITYDTDRITGAEVNNRFTDNGSYDSFGGLEDDMTELSRNAWADTWPTTPTSTTDGSEGTPVIDLDKETFDEVNFEYTPQTTEAEKDQAWYDYFAEMGNENWTQGEDNGIAFSEMAGVAWDDAKWDEYMNQLTWDEMRDLCYNGGYKTMAIERLGIPKTEQADGPVAIKGSSGTTESGIQWVSGINVAATWSVELAELRGIMVGNEGLQLGLNGWYAPGLNIHRSPFGGRNFEYFSEDGVLNGKIATAIVQGCQSKGVICFIKHFAINNQEEDRGAALPGMNMPGSSEFGLLTWASEQVVREIYLKAFQMCVEEGGAAGLMSSMNHTGLRSNTNNFELLTGVLREEWGFKGYTVTDVVPASPANPYADTETLCRTGIDTILGAGNEDAGPTQGEWDADATNMWGGKGSVIVASGDQNDITYASVRNSAKRILYTSVNTAANKNGLDTSGFGAENTLSINIGVSSALKVNAGSNLGTGDVQYEMTSGTLPQGLSFTSDGSLEGTPIQAGTFTFTVKMIADGWIEAEQTFTLTVNNDLFEISETAGTVGKAFSGTISSSYLAENEATVEYSVYAGELPEGMTLAADGTLGGTPVQAGEYQVTIAADAVEEEESSGSVTTTQSQYLFNVTFTVTDSAKYTVTVQYGTGCAAQVESVYAGQSLTLADPVRYGYTFTGWYTDEACTKQASLISISSDMTIYAGWAEIAEAVEESGCGSVIGTGSVLLGAGVLLAAAAVALVVCRSKKKA